MPPIGGEETGQVRIGCRRDRMLETCPYALHGIRFRTLPESDGQVVRRVPFLILQCALRNAIVTLLEAQNVQKPSRAAFHPSERI